MRKFTFFAGMLLAGLGTSPALAQSASDFDHRFTRGEGRVAVGILMPFGGTKAERVPQLELRMTRQLVDASGSRLPALESDLRTSRVALTLGGGQRWLVNGRAIESSKGHGISTLGGIAIATGVALVIGGVLLADAARDASE